MARHAIRPRLRAALPVALTLALIAGIAIATLGQQAGGHPHAGHDHGSHAHLDLHNGLLVSTRTALRICVEPGDHRPTVESGILAALDRVRRHPHWQAAYGKAQYHHSGVLAWGCPAPRLPERYTVKGTVAGPGVTAEPSPYRVWIYVLDGPTADRVLGPDLAAGVAAAEFMRDSNSAFPVSTALLVRESHLADTATLASHLSAAVGLSTT